MILDTALALADLAPAAARVLALGGDKARRIAKTWDPAQGTPVFTVAGTYATRGWTEWTQGFQYGSALLAFDGTGEADLLELGRDATLAHMAPHVTHIGVHDHGFNNLSTYGNLRRLAREGRIDVDAGELRFYDLAIAASACAQAQRWTARREADGSDGGYIHSFNGPHSLFIDTIRTVRILGLAHQLGHRFQGEGDAVISLLGRAVVHGLTTARYNVYFGPDAKGNRRDVYDVRGRTAHEAIFNTKDGRFRCPSSQQGFAPFTTWTRGLAWAVLGYAEELEFLATLPARDFVAAGLGDAAHANATKAAILTRFRDTAQAVCDGWIDHATAADGIPYWDTGAPDLHRLGDWRARPADPFNDHEPVDASAAAIAAQGLLRLGRIFAGTRGHSAAAKRYTAAGLTVAKHLFTEPYLSTDPRHQGLILHSIYHRPNGWDHTPKGRRIPCGESSMWGDYHALELALYLQRLAQGGDLVFFDR